MQCCEICRYAFEVFGLARPLLICNKKFGCGDKFFVVWQQDYCKNFKAKESLPIPEPPADDSDNVRFIPLTQGKFAVVDVEDYNWLAGYKWCVSQSGNSFYAMRNRCGTKVLMHRQIMNASNGLLVDHIDGNGLNNRRSNLRLCTRYQNSCNSRPHRNNLYSKYKGVRWDKRYNKWYAGIRKSGKQFFLGSFDNEIDAAKAYDKKAKELFGEFAYLNFGTSPQRRGPKLTI